MWIMRQAGRYLPEFNSVRSTNDFFSVCRTPSLAAKVTLQPIDRYNGLLDAAIIFSDILVVPQAMGLTVEMIKGTGPHFPAPLGTPDDFERLVMKPDVDGELGYVYEAITLTRMELKVRIAYLGV